MSTSVFEPQLRGGLTCGLVYFLTDDSLVVRGGVVPVQDPTVECRRQRLRSEFLGIFGKARTAVETGSIEPPFPHNNGPAVAITTLSPKETAQNS